MSLTARFNSLMVELTLQPNAPATSPTEHTTGGESDTAPRDAFKYRDEHKVEEIITSALASVESLTRRIWDGTRHVAKPHTPYDKGDWERKVLEQYVGVRNRLVAAEENVPHYVIRDLRKKHGVDGYGHKK